MSMKSCVLCPDHLKDASRSRRRFVEGYSHPVCVACAMGMKHPRYGKEMRLRLAAYNGNKLKLTNPVK